VLDRLAAEAHGDSGFLMRMTQLEMSQQLSFAGHERYKWTPSSLDWNGGLVVLGRMRFSGRPS